MKRTALILLMLGISLTYCLAREKDLAKIADSISAEGNILFRSEWASWYGTDIFMDKCKDKTGQQAGYISYDNGKGLTNIFYSKGDKPVVLATTTFGYDFNPANYSLDTVSRKLTPGEFDLYAIRAATTNRMNTDTIFKFYKNTQLNVVPIIANSQKRVYVLTGPNVNGVVIFGNDYMIDFNYNNSIRSVRRLHKNIISVNYKKDVGDTNPDVASIHTHLPETGDFITATDICTLMLYEKFTTWNQHIVISKNYVSLWERKTNKLVILTAEAWKKIYHSINNTPATPENH